MALLLAASVSDELVSSKKTNPTYQAEYELSSIHKWDVREYHHNKYWHLNEGFYSATQRAKYT